MTKKIDRALIQIVNNISRGAITSGNDTKVPDESVFMKYLVKVLSENKEKYITAQRIFITKIIEAVRNESKPLKQFSIVFYKAILNNSDTSPQYAAIKNVGDEGGGFVFIKK